LVDHLIAADHLDVHRCAKLQNNVNYLVASGNISEIIDYHPVTCVNILNCEKSSTD
jgi:hypothetical protein